MTNLSQNRRFEMNDDEQRLRLEVCRIARVLYERGHNAPADGNISVRLDAEHLLATPSGGHKGELSAEQIVKVRLADGKGLDGRPSSELAMHRVIYEARPDVQAIVHAHSPYAVALTVAGRSLEASVVPEAILYLGAIPTVPYVSPTTGDLAEAVRPYAEANEGFILERHGPVTLGTTLDEAFRRLEVLEHTAKITAIALTLGSASPLPPEEAAKLRALAP